MTVAGGFLPMTRRGPCGGRQRSCSVPIWAGLKVAYAQLRGNSFNAACPRRTDRAGAHHRRGGAGKRLGRQEAGQGSAGQRW
jgi:hypothetical protein